ncbi:MAG: 50S ribosomal protein L4 [Planctomycetota bacterium]
MELTIYSQGGQKIGTVALPEGALGEILRKDLLGQAVIMYEANRRRGTASAKRVGEVAGSGKKPHRQKHTGWARAGKKRAPHYRKGGTAHGPKPRDFSYRLNRQMLHVALQSALLGKVRDGEVRVVESMEVSGAKSKGIRGIIQGLGIEGSCLIGMSRTEPSIQAAARNFPDLTVRTVDGLNAYEVLRAKNLLLTRKGFSDLMVRFQKG